MVKGFLKLVSLLLLIFEGVFIKLLKSHLFFYKFNQYLKYYIF